MRWQRAIHFAPGTGLGAARRAVLFALITWLPIAVWAFMRGRFVASAVGEPLLQHYGVHVRCLVAIPLLIVGERTLHNAGLRYVPAFIRNGLVDDAARPRFEAVLRGVRSWRDASLPWLLAIGAALAWTLLNRTGGGTDEMSWAFEASGAIGFGGLWFTCVARPIFAALLLGWLWRIVLLTLLFARVSALDLSLVPSHPDRSGGLGFVERFPGAFAPVSLALSAMLASRWAHQIVYHGQTLGGLKLQAATFVIVWSLMLLAPLAALIRIMHGARRAALGAYAAMIAEQGRLVRHRWIDKTSDSDAPLIEPSGVGVVADVNSMFNAVQTMRSVPIGLTAIAGILMPVSMPMLAVASLQVPVKDLLFGLVKALV